MRMKERINLGNLDTVKSLKASLNAEVARGKDGQNWHEVRVRPVRLTQSEKLRNYYYAEVVEAFRAFLAEDHPTADKGMAHRRLKLACGLAIFEVNPLTHELEVTGTISLADLRTDELWEYVQKARAWLDTDVGCPTEDPDQRKAGRKRQREAVPA